MKNLSLFVEIFILMDLVAFRKSLKTLQATQDEIPRLSRAVACHPAQAEILLTAMVEEAVANASKRLLIFYLFNDIVQYSARKRITEFLEKGSGVFLHGFGPLVHRLPIAERSSYLRTIDIWRERAVYSENFCARLKIEWGSDGKVRRGSEAADPADFLKAVDAARVAGEAAKQRYREALATLCGGQQLPADPSDAATLLKALEAVETEISFELQNVGVACLGFS